MPVDRTVLARDAHLCLEQVRAPGHGVDWGTVHRAPDWRWVLPGSGGVQWRGAGQQLFVDELTAFHLRAGEDYQLQHAAGRTHVVLSAGRPAVRGGAARGWLVDPRGVFQLRLAARQAASGARPTDAALAAAAQAVDGAFARAVPLAGATLPPALQRARRLLAAEPAAWQSLDSLGEAAAASPFHLARLFRRHLGLPPHQYRLRLRLALAIAQLEQGERDLAGLAHALGFSSQSHFGALFRREVGVTPAQARRALSGR